MKQGQDSSKNDTREAGAPAKKMAAKGGDQPVQKMAPAKADPLFKPKELGRPYDRRDGVLKVTGGAKYSAEHNLPKTAWAVAVGSPVAKGRLREVDIRLAEAVPGVVRVLTPFNAPK
ncbi:hypothetical protein EON77_16760, partial [bacterium]